MAKSIRHLLIENIVSTLAGITVAAGYNNTILSKNIFRGILEAGSQMVWPTLFLDVSDVPTVRLSDEVSDRKLTATITLALGGTLKVLPDSVEYAVADIVKAMNADTTRGGYAQEQSEPDILEPTYSQILEGHAYIKLVYAIDYRTNRLDPTVA